MPARPTPLSTAACEELHQLLRTDVTMMAAERRVAMIVARRGYVPSLAIIEDALSYSALRQPVSQDRIARALVRLADAGYFAWLDDANRISA